MATNNCRQFIKRNGFGQIEGNTFQNLLNANNLTDDQRNSLNNNFEGMYIPVDTISSRDKIAIVKIFWKYDVLKYISKYNGIKHWNSDGTHIRGHKFYWHRTGNDWVDNDNVKDHNAEPDDQHTKIRPVKNDVNFKGRIRFENLSKIELGALLFALDLPDGCCHKLGMGKPLGLGSIKIKPKLYISDRKKRYEELFAEWEDEIEPKDEEEIKEFKKEFANYILGKVNNAKVGEKAEEAIDNLWKTSRMQELKAMLDYNNKPDDNRTEYMKLPEFKERKVLSLPTEVGR